MSAPVYRYLTAHPHYAPNGDRMVAELPLEGVKWGRTLSGAGSVSAKVNAKHPSVSRDTLREGYHQLVIERDGVVVWCGGIWTATVSMQMDDPYVTIGAKEWFSWFLPDGDTTNCLPDDPLTGGSPLVWDSMDQIEVAGDIIRMAQTDIVGQAGNRDQGIEVATNALSGIVRNTGEIDHQWFEFASYGEIISSMAQKADGFDFLIECDWNPNTEPFASVRKMFTTYFPRKSGRASAGIDEGVKLAAIGATFDATRMGSHFNIQGAGTGDDMITATADVHNDSWHRDFVRKFDEIEDANVLAQQADAAAQRYGKPVQLPNPTIVNDRSGGFDFLTSFELGHLMPVNLSGHYVGINELLRIVAYDVTVGTGVEQISIVFNLPEAADFA